MCDTLSRAGSRSVGAKLQCPASQHERATPEQVVADESVWQAIAWAQGELRLDAVHVRPCDVGWGTAGGARWSAPTAIAGLPVSS